MAENVFKVLTYNIHKGFNTGNRQFVLHQIREALRVTGADLLFLQEMQGEHIHKERKINDWPEKTQFEFIAEEVWPFYAYGKNAIYDAGHHGNAILSKHEFLSWENINVSPLPWASRSLLHASIKMGPTLPEVHIVCIHFGLLGGERRQQIKKLCGRIDSHVPHDAPLIVAGDFNDWLGRADHLLYDHLDLKEIFLTTHGRYARTFPSWLPFLQMDRIYFRGLRPVACARLSHAPWHQLSDHAPLTAEFGL